MSKDELMAGILNLPPDERRILLHEAMESLPDEYKADPDMTPELRAKLERRHQEMLDRPETVMTLDEARAYWAERARKGVAAS